MKKLLLLTILIFGSSFLSIKAQYTKLLDFDSTNGALSECNLTLVGNTLYGMTTEGGAISQGCIFSIHTDGSNYKHLYDFDTVHGRQPTSSLTYANGLLYGTTSDGGAYDFGTVFSIDTNGNNMKILHSFNYTEVYWPQGPLTLIGNVLYGASQYGGLHRHGVIFAIDTAGNNYRDLHDFDSIHGNGTYSPLLLIRNKLYGLSPTGGALDTGCIFSIDTSGNAYADIFDFNGANGSNPTGALALSNNTLFGATLWGGSYGDGSFFSIDTTGNNYKDLHDFNVLNGWSPTGVLLSGNTLYATTSGGGPWYWYGSICSIDTSGNNFKDQFFFDSTNTGFYPYGGLTLLGNTFYGATWNGGSHNVGTLYSFIPCTVNNFDEPICVVTIDTATNKCKVIWGRTNSPPDSASYNVYRDTIPGFALVHTQNLNVLSQYLDTASNPSLGPVSYELSTIDSCGESALSAPHTTIFLTTSSGPNVYILNWTAYVGFTPSLYRIFRGPSLNSMVEIDSVPNTVLTYRDTLPPVGSIYAVEAVNPFFTCVATPKVLSHKLHGPTLSGSFSNGFNTGVLGIPSLDAAIANLKIYPNPNKGMFTLSYSMNAASTVQISIMDELGQVVYNNTEQKGAGSFNEYLNLEKLAAGIYSLRIQTSAGITVSKVAIVR